MATTFIGLELGDGGDLHHAAVVLHSKKGNLELRHWSCLIKSDVELLEYMAEMAGKSGVIAVHGLDPDATSLLLQRMWRVLDYKMAYALAPRHRTRAVVRVQPFEVEKAFACPSDPSPLAALETMHQFTPSVDYKPLTRCLLRLRREGAVGLHFDATLRAALASYAAVWCWWHGPAGYDVLGANAETYRLAPRIMDVEPDTGRTPF